MMDNTATAGCSRGFMDFNGIVNGVIGLGHRKNFEDLEWELSDEPRNCSAAAAPMQVSDGTVRTRKESRSMKRDARLASLSQAQLNVPVKVLRPSSLGAHNTASMTLPKPSVNSSSSKRICFRIEELLNAFMPVINKLFALGESLPFRQPVDPYLLGIPDYFDVVKNPMDLSTIRKKLMEGEYMDPWEVNDDVWLMFGNAWYYNKKQSRVYKCCTKLSEVFENDVDPIMKTFGYCCGKKYKYHPVPILCCGSGKTNSCTIQKDVQYYAYEDKYFYCTTCFNASSSDVIVRTDDDEDETQLPRPIVLKKTEFVKKINDTQKEEPFVDCKDCGRKFHKICVLYTESIWPSGFRCDACLVQSRRKRENKFTAQALPTSKMSDFIENRVNGFLMKRPSTAGKVSIRVLSAYDKKVEVKDGMRQRYNGIYPDTFPYRAKTIFAFQEVEGADVCFFGIHVQEYGSDCPEPNARCVYIAYLDSIHFFTPKAYRTQVYQEIILGYLEFVKSIGFCTAYIWASPPSQGDDYIFYCHPQEQKIPKQKRLQDWYKKLLDKGVDEDIIVEYQDILKSATTKGKKFRSPTELPYFEGDFWPKFMEETIESLNKENKCKQAKQIKAKVKSTPEENNNSMTQMELRSFKQGSSQLTPTNKSKNSKSRKIIETAQPIDKLSVKILESMEKHKDDFFVVRLHLVDSEVLEKPILDPDHPRSNVIMDGRDPFLNLCREKRFEFCTLRRAKYATMGMVYSLHMHEYETATCDSCGLTVLARFQCTDCRDFDLCIPCYQAQGHPHAMEKINFDVLNIEDEDLEHSCVPKVTSRHFPSFQYHQHEPATKYKQTKMPKASVGSSSQIAACSQPTVADLLLIYFELDEVARLPLDSLERRQRTMRLMEIHPELYKNLLKRGPLAKRLSRPGADAADFGLALAFDELDQIARYDVNSQERSDRLIHLLSAHHYLRTVVLKRRAGDMTRELS